jgi:GTP-binding protein
MSLPQVVIVGRPNVGKSSVLNWLVRKRLAIVDDTAGVTRDRVTALVCERDRYFELVDTGGIGFDDPDNLTEHIEDQITAALDSAAVVLFVVDTRAGLTPLDAEVAKRLRYLKVPVITVANKTDDPALDPQADEFYKLGRGKLARVSTRQNRNRRELLDLIVERLPPPDLEAAPREAEMKVAIVGRRNTGKSTFVNTLAQAERMIVSEVPGTTRDSVDVRFELDGKVFVAIDTPGLKRATSIASDVEFYSTHRAHRSIRRADVVLLFFDTSQRVSKVDKQLCDYIAQQYKPCIFVCNKWDLYAGSMPTEKWVTYLRDNFRTMWYVPIAFVTGRTGKNVKALLNHAQMLFKQSHERVATSELNRVLRAALEATPPPLYQNRRPKIYYATQVGIQPPTVVMFCNEPRAIAPDYQRYLLGVFRDYLPFSEVPIKLYLRRREDRAGERLEADGTGEAGGALLNAAEEDALDQL